MLVCPQCHFANPNINKFCQQCGISLTHKICCECGTQVPLDLEQCQNCGTIAGTIWLGIISEAPNAVNPSHSIQVTSKRVEPLPSRPRDQLDPFTQLALNHPELLTPESPEICVNETEIPVNTTNKEVTPIDADGKSEILPTQEDVQSPAFEYLDSQQRYRLLDQLTTPNLTSQEIEIKVLDLQPFQMSLLQAMQESSTRESTLAFPPLARAYLELGAELFPSLPAIHDAWQQGSQTVILLENRGDLPLLVDRWRDRTVLLGQSLSWLAAMLKLWIATSEWNCTQSLLEIDNLRLDEDQVLCLRRLYPNRNPTTPPTLIELGQVWQHLFTQSQRTQIGPIKAPPPRPRNRRNYYH